jgi:alanine racemase
MDSTSTLEIDLSVLDANLASWRQSLGPGCEVCPVVKADAYGLGAVPITRRLAAAGVGMVAVYNMQQATELAAAGLPVQMLVLMPVEQLGRTDVLYRAAVSGKLHLAVHSGAQLDRIEAIGTTFGARLPVHIEVDTGMCRLGMSVEEADRLLGEIARRKYVKLAGLFSHTAAPGSDVVFTDEQYRRFESLLKKHATVLKGVCIHFAGTCAAYRDVRYHKAMVRLGLGLFGYGDPAEEGIPSIDRPPAVRPVARWVSRVVHMRQVGKGTSIGYQRTFVTRRPTTLGVVPVGHADGYPVSLSNKGIVRIGPEAHPAPVLGQVNMDQVMVDLTDAGAGVAVGTEVELYAADPQAPNALPRLAAVAQTNCYELLCRLSPRLQRRYIVHDRQTGRIGHVATV